MRAKAMDLANEEYKKDPTRKRFACSATWLRSFKARYNIVRGRIVGYQEISLLLSQQRLRGLSSSEPHDPLLQPLYGFPTFVSQSFAEPTRASDGTSFSPISFTSTISGPRADTNSPLSAFPPAFADSTSQLEGSTGSLPIWEEGVLPLSMAAYAPSGQSYHTSSPLSPPNFDIPYMPELAASASEHDRMGDVSASDLYLESGSTFSTDMDTSFLSSGGLINVPPALPDNVPFPFPLDYSTGMTPISYIDAPPFFSPFPDPDVPSPLIWSTDVTPTSTSSIDVAVPAMLSTNSVDNFPPQPAYVPREDIDRLAAEMMHWPTENLLDDMGVPMYAADPCDEVPFAVPVPSI